jgi:hypothetical protein
MNMATKKTIPAKAGAKNPSKKPAKETTKKATPKAKAKPAAAKAVKKPATNSSLGTRRPPNNPDMPQLLIDDITSEFEDIKRVLDDYAAHLRALDRKRLNGVGIKTQGFIERAYEYAQTNPEFLPHYLTLDRFGEDNAYFVNFRNLFDTGKQIQEIIWNITLQSADIVYTDALEFYASVREAAKRRVDAAETMFKDLELFFKRKKTTAEEPTEKELKRDINSLLHGKRDGKVVVENIKPKTTGGARKVVDEHFTESAQYKESEEGEIKD